MKKTILFLILLMGLQAQASWWSKGTSWRNPDSKFCQENAEWVYRSLFPENSSEISFVEIRYADEDRNRNIHTRWFTAADASEASEQALEDRCEAYRFNFNVGDYEYAGLRGGDLVCGYKVQKCDWQRIDTSDRGEPRSSETHSNDDKGPGDEGPGDEGPGDEGPGDEGPGGGGIDPDRPA